MDVVARLFVALSLVASVCLLSGYRSVDSLARQSSIWDPTIPMGYIYSSTCRRHRLLDARAVGRSLNQRNAAGMKTTKMATGGSPMGNGGERRNQCRLLGVGMFLRMGLFMISSVHKYTLYYLPTVLKFYLLQYFLSLSLSNYR